MAGRSPPAAAGPSRRSQNTAEVRTGQVRSGHLPPPLTPAAGHRTLPRLGQVRSPPAAAGPRRRSQNTAEVSSGQVTSRRHWPQPQVTEHCRGQVRSGHLPPLAPAAGDRTLRGQVRSGMSGQVMSGKRQVTRSQKGHEQVRGCIVYEAVGFHANNRSPTGSRLLSELC